MIDIQRLRNLTTGRLHTKMSDIYEDIEIMVGEKGIMTHMLPRACKAMNKWLKASYPDPELWDGEYRPNHDGLVELKVMTDGEKKVFWNTFENLPSPLSGEKSCVE